MTGPQPIILPRQPGAGEAVSQGLAPLIQALQMMQQRQMQQQQLSLEQQRTQAQVAESEARTQASRAEIARRTDEAKDEADATKALQDAMEVGGGKLTQEAIFGALAKLKRPGAVSKFIAQVPGLGEALSAPKKLEREDVETQQKQVELDTSQIQLRLAKLQEPVRAAGLRNARRLLSTPNAKLPKDPTVAEATAMASLGLLDFAGQQTRSELESGTGASQAIIFARQQALQTVSSAFREYISEAESSGEAPSVAPNAPERLQKFLPPGMELPQMQQLVKSAVETATEAMRGMPSLDEQIEEAAQLVVKGGTVNPGTPPEIAERIRKRADELRKRGRRTPTGPM